MSSLVIDAEGQRITNDILIVGFIHETARKYYITIPNEIIGIIFRFCFIDVCDESDKSLCGWNVIINEQTAKTCKE